MESANTDNDALVKLIKSRNAGYAVDVLCQLGFCFCDTDDENSLCENLLSPSTNQPDRYIRYAYESVRKPQKIVTIYCGKSIDESDNADPLNSTQMSNTVSNIESIESLDMNRKKESNPKSEFPMTLLSSSVETPLISDIDSPIDTAVNTSPMISIQNRLCKQNAIDIDDIYASKYLSYHYNELSDFTTRNITINQPINKNYILPLPGLDSVDKNSIEYRDNESLYSDSESIQKYILPLPSYNKSCSSNTSLKFESVFDSLVTSVENCDLSSSEVESKLDSISFCGKVSDKTDKYEILCNKINTLTDEIKILRETIRSCIKEELSNVLGNSIPTITLTQDAQDAPAASEDIQLTTKIIRHKIE